MKTPDIRRQIENIVTRNTTAGHLTEAEHRDFSDSGSIMFDMIPMLKDLEILIRNLECLQKDSEHEGVAMTDTDRRLSSCCYATLRLIAALKSMISRNTSESFARELIKTAMDRHFGTVSYAPVLAGTPAA